ncbi:MAG: MFS transporter, partial [Phaeodactylibacter sp.]|nr:MFS transporter [Phaeodactylibacter sp.]
MLQRTIQLYANSFAGLSRDIWLLSFITLVNRSGTMVLPFLTVYMTAGLDFTLTQAGMVMGFFGGGSMLGAWIGGKLTDRFGFYGVMFGSLVFGGAGFIGLIFVQSFWELCIAVFILSSIADTFRPAVFAAIAAYSKPENLTRSSTLLRLAINLGFSVGPAVGGVLAATVGYSA